MLSETLFKNLKLEYHETYVEDGQLYLSLEYSYYDEEKNRHAFAIPKIELPIYQNSRPILLHKGRFLYENWIVPVFTDGLQINSVNEIKFHNKKVFLVIL